MYHLEFSVVFSDGSRAPSLRPDSFGDEYGLETPRVNAFDTVAAALDLLDAVVADPYDVVYARRSRGGRVLLVGDGLLVRIKKD